VFQPFLDQGLQRPVRGRGHLVSLALHGLAAVLIWLAWGPVEPGAPAGDTRASVVVSLAWPSLRAAPAPAVEPPAAGPPAVRRSRARPAPVVVIGPSQEAPVSEERVVGDEQGDPLEPGSGGAGASGPEGTPVESAPVESRPARRRPLELYGRVVGGSRREGVGSNGLPYAPLKESTALRTYDFFPPLPASQWTSERPYLVVVDVCVSGEGQVSDVALVRPASPSFDPVLLEAVRTWRYKPRLVDGNARAFCHVVAIKYEQL
jgi:hypothetical protein